jgi:hypothetical protein
MNMELGPGIPFVALAAFALGYLTARLKPRRQPVARITLRIHGGIAAGDHMTICNTDTDKGALYEVELEDAHGNPVPAEEVESILWGSSLPGIVNLQTPYDGSPLKAFAELTGTAGDTQISFSADADLGAGVSTIALTDDLRALAGAAVQAKFKGVTVVPITPTP